ncbi:MAG: glycosyltransferase family 2 protein [Candidatus Aceula meridiana]|nr:glycosyltransferase family 2 protein [Candidatus Aceula meridiana]
MPKILVCPVAFNEHIKIKKTIERFLKSSAHGKVDYLVVDDGSTDETTQIINQFFDQGVGTIRHDKRSGVGTAIRTAICFAREKDYEIIVIMAGNDKDDPNQIMDLVSQVAEYSYDFVQGSRYLKEGKIGGDMPFYRKMATQLHPFLFSLFTKRKITDSTNGFRAIRLSLFNNEQIDFHQSWLNAYELEPYLLFKAVTLGYRYIEVPVTKIYPPKELGYTKMRPFLGWWSILKPIFYLGFGFKK